MTKNKSCNRCYKTKLAEIKMQPCPQFKTWPGQSWVKLGVMVAEVSHLSNVAEAKAVKIVLCLYGYLLAYYYRLR